MLVDLMLTRSLLVEVAAHSTAHIHAHKNKLRIHQHQNHVSSAALTRHHEQGQVLREVAVNDKPAVLVLQGQCQDLVHQMAGLCGTAFHVCQSGRRGCHWGFRLLAVPHVHA
jgi:hypothetical protein